MENMQKAIIMAGSVFMFIIAISVAMISYSTVQDVIGQILTASERNARTAEYFIEISEDTERYATRAEVIMAIYSMQDKDYSPDIIKVAGATFKKEDFKTVSGKNQIYNAVKHIPEGTYSIEYNFSVSGVTSVEYEKKGS